MRNLGLGDLGFLGAVGTVPWTPANITTALWLDAADASTITTASGVVSQWNDKSGNSRNATQGTAASRPAYTSNLQGGLPGVVFDGLNDWMESASVTLLPSNTTDYIMAGVFRVGASKQFGSVFMHTNGSRNCALQRDGSNVNVYAENSNVNQYVYARNTSIGIDAIVYQGSSNPRIAYRNNGSLVTFISSPGTAPASLTPATGAYLLGRTASNFELDCSIFELVLFPGSSSSTNYERVEGYLAHKWGLTANLPAGHPYKSAAPTV